MKPVLDSARIIEVLGVSVGTLVTVGVWWLHLTGSWFDEIYYRNHILYVIIVSLPPFVSSFCAGQLLFPKLNERPEDRSGPLSGYMELEKGARRWKIVMIALLIAIINGALSRFTLRAV